MRKAILISIRQKWCELIANGDKTVEIRKTKPNAILPVKCYIYETLGNERAGNAEYNYIKKGNGRGNVIGEFVCHNIFAVWPGYIGGDCLTFEQQENYLGENGCGYAWGISNLVIYKKPKKLGEFRYFCDNKKDCFSCKRCREKKYDCIAGLTRPPKSWCYVEENT